MNEVLTWGNNLIIKNFSKKEEEVIIKRKRKLCADYSIISKTCQNYSSITLDYHFPSSFARHNIYFHYFFSHFLLSIKVPWQNCISLAFQYKKASFFNSLPNTTTLCTYAYWIRGQNSKVGNYIISFLFYIKFIKKIPIVNDKLDVHVTDMFNFISVLKLNQWWLLSLLCFQFVRRYNDIYIKLMDRKISWDC